MQIYHALYYYHEKVWHKMPTRTPLYFTIMKQINFVHKSVKNSGR